MYRSRLPRLSQITTNSIKNKPETPKALKKLLLPKEELELEEISLSGSEISDVFVQFHEIDDFSSSKRNISSSNQETDQLPMKQFTKNFIDTMQDVRKELQLDQNITTETIEEIRRILNEHRTTADLPPSTQERINEILKDSENICSTPSQTSEDAPTTRKGSSIGFDVISGMWKMLAVYDTKEKLRISSPTFNAFQQDDPHWLNRPAISWKTIDFAKHKCEKWLNEQRSG